jgi:transposase-like protein
MIQDVAAALDIHPFMLSLWRKQVRQGVIVARASKLDVETTAESRRLKELERRIRGRGIRRNATRVDGRYLALMGSQNENAV